MAIEGLTRVTTPERVPLSELYMSGTPDVAEAVDVTMHLFTELGKVTGLQIDPETTEASVRADYTAVADLGYNGRLFPALSAADATFEALFTTAEAKKPRGVVGAYRYPNLWVPGTEPQSYTQAELNGTRTTSQGRIALFRSPSIETKTPVDPILHHLELPYDEMYKEANHPETQQEAVVRSAAEFTHAHQDYNLTQLTASDYAVLTLMDRIRGIEPESEDFLLNQGFMRTELGRRTVVDDSFVGGVLSNEGRLLFDWAYGRANDVDGVGLSAGQIEA